MYIFLVRKKVMRFLQIILIYQVNDPFANGHVIENRISILGSRSSVAGNWLHGVRTPSHPPGTAVTCYSVPNGTQINKGSYSYPSSRQHG